MKATRRAWAASVFIGLAGVALAGCTGKAPTPGPADTQGSGAAQVGTAAGLQSTFEQVVRNVLPSTVQITSGTGLGSGILLDGKGDIVTNAHVVGSGKRFQVALATGGSPLPATLVASYPPDDLAVVKLDKAPATLRPATFADSAKVRVGELVMAMGNPLGLSGSVTEGIVSATGRTVNEPRATGSPGATIANAIQTSAEINPGNSGGALVDLAGHVVGIPTLAATDPQLGGVAPGIGFAIPSDTVTDIAHQIVANGRVTNSHRAALDVTARTVVDANGQPAGVGIVSVASGGAADKAGIRAGDVITAVDGTAVPGTDALAATLARHQPGDRVKVSLRRPDGSTADVTVTLGQLG